MHQKVVIIAEAGVNHNGSLELARQLVDVAAAAGADYVKFQTFIAEHNISRTAQKAAYQVDTTGEAESQLEMVKKLELSRADHLALIAYCRERGIRFSSTAFDTASVEMLDEFDLDFSKVPSGELTNLPFLRQIGALGRPVIMSTGMANLGEVETALDILVAAGTLRERITVLHCNTEYPTPMADVNLRAMTTIGQALGVAVGYSDHTLGIEVPIAAVALGAVCIEKHITLDKTLPGPDHRASLEPHELTAMVTAIRNIEAALGDGRKRPSASETPNRAIARKSIHLAADRPAGHILTASDLIMKRPGDGISPMEIDSLIGRQVVRALPEDHKLRLADLV